jgi:hypothetical protein
LRAQASAIRSASKRAELIAVDQSSVAAGMQTGTLFGS